MEQYTYETQLNGYCLEIFNGKHESVGFLQGEDAENILIGLEETRNFIYPTNLFATREEFVSFLLEDYVALWGGN